MCILQFNPFSTLLASGCTNGDILLWAWETRAIAGQLAGGHSDPITALLWNATGRQLLSTSFDGSLILWDVLQGRIVRKENLCCGSITALSCPVLGEPHFGAVMDLQTVRLIASFAHYPAQSFTLDNISHRQTVPVVGLDAGGRLAYALSTGIDMPPDTNATYSSNKTTSNHMAAVSPDGAFIVGVSRGLITLVRAKDLGVLDVTKMRSTSQPATSIEFDSRSRRVIVATDDRLIRVFDLPVNDKFDVAEQSILEALVGRKPPKDGSLLFPENPRLRLTRLFDAQVERVGWGPVAFDPEGGHIVSAINDPQEHILYLWNVEHGYAVSTLQGGKDGIKTLAWRPSSAPAQLLAVSVSGKMYVWAKVISQNWSAFAPDFETLTDNREHLESETEFDVDPPPNEGDASISADGQHGGAEEDDVDIEGWAWLGQSSNNGEYPATIWHGGADVGDGPLYTLPVEVPTELVVEMSEEEEGKGPASNEKSLLENGVLKEEERAGVHMGPTEHFGQEAMACAKGAVDGNDVPMTDAHSSPSENQAEEGDAATKKKRIG